LRRYRPRRSTYRGSRQQASTAEGRSPPTEPTRRRFANRRTDSVRCALSQPSRPYSSGTTPGAHFLGLRGTLASPQHSLGFAATISYSAEWWSSWRDSISDLEEENEAE